MGVVLLLLLLLLLLLELSSLCSLYLLISSCHLQTHIRILPYLDIDARGEREREGIPNLVLSNRNRHVSLCETGDAAIIMFFSATAWWMFYVDRCSRVDGWVAWSTVTNVGMCAV